MPFSYFGLNSDLQRGFPLAVTTARLARPQSLLALGVGSGGKALAEVALLPLRARCRSSSCACCSYTDVKAFKHRKMCNVVFQP